MKITRIFNLSLLCIIAVSCKPPKNNSATKNSTSSIINSEDLKRVQTLPELFKSLGVQDANPNSALELPIDPACFPIQSKITEKKPIYVDTATQSALKPFIQSALSKIIEQNKPVKDGFFVLGTGSWQSRVLTVADCFDISLNELLGQKWLYNPSERFYLTPEDEQLYERAQTELNFSQKPGDDTNFRIENVIDALSFIDYWDLALELSNNRSMPWRRYTDNRETKSLLARWREPFLISPTMNNLPLKTLFGVHNSLCIGAEELCYHPGEQNESPDSFRGTKTKGGGDFGEDGSMVPFSYDDKVERYFSLSKQDWDALKNNPFLTPKLNKNYEDKCGDNVYPENPKSVMCLGLYHYPSLESARLPNATFTKFLSEETKNKIVQNKDAAPGTTEFKNVTRLILTDLGKELESWKLAPETLYQFAVSLHPFLDYNGRSGRKWESILSNNEPLFLVNFDNDLYQRPEEFLISVHVGKRMRRMIIADFMREKIRAEASKQMPDYYATSAFWLVGANISPAKLSAAEKKKLSEALRKDWFHQDKVLNLISHKQNVELDALVAQFAAQILKNKLP